MISIDQVINRAKKHLKNLNEERVRKAFELAKKCHCGQKRATGEDYICHPLEIANNLLDFLPDEDALIAALLHDVTEDCENITLTEIEEGFGKTVAELVGGMEKLSRIQAHGEERKMGSLRKMFLAMAKDIRVVLIKLVDRLHNMQTLHSLPKEKQKRIAEETLSIYAPIAARLGIYALKSPLEDLAFFYLYTEDYTRIAQQMKKHEPYRTRILKNARKSIEAVLEEENLPGEISGRVKHYYSIYKKITDDEHQSIDDLYDIFALRVVVPTVKDCYIVLGRVHQYWTPLANRFKDYIAVPKPNGYRSLHTTVIGLSGIKTKSIPIEIQIRTQEMQEEAEYGIAAHWLYKEESTGESEKREWVKDLVEIGEKLKSNVEFAHDIELDTFSDRIFVLTPNGNIKDLPQGATPIDFAFAVHTDIGLHARAAKVDGNIVPLDHPLDNGNVVEIVTGKNAAPSQNWLSFVVTSQARNRIRNYLKSQDRDKIVREGKELLNKHLSRFKLGELDPHLHILKIVNGRKLSMTEREELLERVGNGSISAVSVVKNILRDQETVHRPKVEIVPQGAETKAASAESGKTNEILIAGEPKIPTKIANCCEPQEGDPIIGFITRGGHATVHRLDCRIARNLEKSRLVEARWASDKSTATIFVVETAGSRIGLLRDIVDVFARHKINLDKFGYSDSTSPLSATIHLRANVRDLELVSHLMDRLEEIDGVASVKTQ